MAREITDNWKEEMHKLHDRLDAVELKLAAKEKAKGASADDKPGKRK